MLRGAPVALGGAASVGNHRLRPIRASPHSRRRSIRLWINIRAAARFDEFNLPRRPLCQGVMGT